MLLIKSKRSILDLLGRISAQYARCKTGEPIAMSSVTRMVPKKLGLGIR